MSSASSSVRTPTGEVEPESVSPAPETVFELLNDDHARAILDLLDSGPKPARELIDRTEASKPTVYRRLNRLEVAGIVESTTAIHPDGHHRKEFARALEHVSLSVGAGVPERE